MINAHTHLQYSGMVQVGQGTYDRFRAWELAFNEVYAEAQKTQPWKQWAEDGARQMVESGTTAAADIVTDLTPPARWLRRACTASLIGR